MRRMLVSGLSVVVLILAAVVPAMAQVATPASDLASLGFPELNVTVNAAGYEGIPSTLQAGRYLVNVTVAADVTGDGGEVAFMQPVGLTTDDVLGILSGPAASGTAEAMPMASPAADQGDEEGSAPPPEFYQFKLAGGAGAPPNGTAQIVLDLTPGDWIAWGDDPSATQQPVVFTVTGEMPADLVEPPSSATISLSEYVIKVTAGEIKAGPQVLRIDNIGAQPHFIYAAKGPDSLTDEQVSQVLEGEMSGTPADVPFNPDTDLQPVFVTGTQSTGTSTWLSVDLDPGTYALLCFFPDMADGMPHAMHGMHMVIEVKG